MWQKFLQNNLEIRYVLLCFWYYTLDGIFVYWSATKIYLMHKLSEEVAAYLKELTHKALYTLPFENINTDQIANFPQGRLLC